jgi:hypothetical protein
MGNGEAMEILERESLQDEEVEGALEEVCGRHIEALYESRVPHIDCQ